MAAEFDRLDKDGNGVLSPDEVVVVIKEIMNLDDVRAAKMVTTTTNYFFYHTFVLLILPIHEIPSLCICIM